MSIRVEVDETPPASLVPDYSDAFAVSRSASDTRSAEEWVRAVFEGAPRALRVGLPIIWGRALGLRLGPRPSPHHVLGWPIVSAEPSVVVLGTQAPLFAVNVVLRRDTARVVLTAFIRFEPGVVTRTLFAGAAPIHRQVNPYLLKRAARAAE